MITVSKNLLELAKLLKPHATLYVVGGYVRDFFKLNFVDFPVFNISDIFITIGVLALIVLIVKNKYLRK